MLEAMRYISLFSGIEAASAAWSQLGWEPIAFSEIEPFCCDLLNKRFPNVPNLGDISTVEWSKYEGAADVIIGGSPCQAYSIAGKREGMLDERGMLMLEYVRAVREVKPRWVVWENVPGVLSQDGGRAFAALLEELEECGYSLAWRVLDAQFWGVAQRRRRVFLVGHPIAGCAAAVLFEPGSLRGDTPTSREKRAELTLAAGRSIGGDGRGRMGLRACPASPTTAEGDSATGCLTPWDVQSRRIYGTEIAAPTLSAQDRDGGHNSVNVLAFDTTQVTDPRNGNNPQFDDPCHTIIAASHPPTIAFSAGQSDKAGSVGAQEEVAPTLRSSASGTNQVPTIAFNYSMSGTRGFAESEEVSPTLRSSPGNCSNMPAVVTQYGSDIAGTLMARGDSSPCADRGMNVICMATQQGGAEIAEDMCPTIAASAGMSGNNQPVVCMASGQANAETMVECCPTLTRRGCKDSPIAANGYAVRRLTPVECERLQGFPDGWTDIYDNTPDTPRYKAIGNSMAVPVIKWIGEQIAMVENAM